MVNLQARPYGRCPSCPGGRGHGLECARPGNVEVMEQTRVRKSMRKALGGWWAGFITQHGRRSQAG